MKDLGELHYCLGLEVWRDSIQTFLSQGKYAKSLLTKFKMDECKAAFVPLQQNSKLQVNDGLKYADATLYRQLVGSLIYLTTTRPDLAYAMSVLSQFMTQPHENHWLEMKGVLRWSLIVGQPGRTDNEIKNYWNTHLNRKAHGNDNVGRLKSVRLT
eukprot:PITA_04004